VRSLDVILETLGDCAARTRDVDIMSEYVRNGLARSICQSLLDEEGRVHVVTLDPKLEEIINAGIEHADRGSFLTLKPALIQRICRAIACECEKLTSKGFQPVVLCSPQVRLQVKRMTEPSIPQLVVVSYNEIVKDVEVESEGMVVTE
jgi:flagellar biosynthesis protein FlhA